MPIGGWFTKILEKFGWRKTPTQRTTDKARRLGSQEQKAQPRPDLEGEPSRAASPRRADSRAALQIGFDFGTHSTKIVIRRRGERIGHVISVADPAMGYTPFVMPSLVRVHEDSMWFGGEALTQPNGKLYSLLKLRLLETESTAKGGNLSTDFLVAAYFGWVLCGIRKWIQKQYSLDNTKLFLNVAAPMDHYENSNVKQRYLKILGTAWELVFGGDRKLITQRASTSLLLKWFSECDLVVPNASVRPYDVLPETIAPIVSLSQDPRMKPGMYQILDMGAGTTEFSVNYVSVPGGEQNVLCYYDRSVLLGAERFRNGQDIDALLTEFRKHVWQSWCHGYGKDARNAFARQRWNSVIVLLVGGGTLRADVQDALGSWEHPVVSRFPGVGRSEVLRHGPANLEFGSREASVPEISLASVANGLAFPRMQWPTFYEPEQLPPIEKEPTKAGDDNPWYLDR